MALNYTPVYISGISAWVGIILFFYALFIVSDIQLAKIAVIVFIISIAGMIASVSVQKDFRELYKSEIGNRRFDRSGCFGV